MLNKLDTMEVLWGTALILTHKYQFTRHDAHLLSVV